MSLPARPARICETCAPLKGELLSPGPKRIAAVFQPPARAASACWMAEVVPAWYAAALSPPTLVRLPPRTTLGSPSVMMKRSLGRGGMLPGGLFAAAAAIPLAVGVAPSDTMPAMTPARLAGSSNQAELGV